VEPECEIHIVRNPLKRKYVPVIFDRLLCISSMGGFVHFRFNGFAVVGE
jgi:hypothetical protein